MLGLRLVDHGADWVTLAIDDGRRLAGPDDRIAAGPLLGMIDMAASMAVWARRGRFAPHVTLDLRLDWLRAPPADAVLHGRGECHAIEGEIAFVRGTIHAGDSDRPVATVAGTFMLLGDAA